MNDQAFEAYLTEYRECMDSYRHTYQTIWQAGALFAAISAAIVTFASKFTSARMIEIPAWVQVLAPLPILFWYLGIFRPMNRYGEIRNDRLAAIEEILSNAIPDLDMRHARGYSQARKGESPWSRLLRFKWVWRPRVVEVVTILGIGMLALEAFLILKNYLF